MGISGLLPLLKEIQMPRNIADFKGKRLAVDAYVWLHRGAFGCAEDLVKGKKTTRFVDYAMHRVRMLRYHGITPFVVFDGGPLPAKRSTEESREKSRADNLAKAQAFEAQGRWKEARDCYTKCLDITPEMAYQLIKALRAEGVEYVVAPYEADAQLCYLEREGFVDGVITEDSDLLVFGCKTVIFKLEKDGSCVSLERARLATVRELPMHGWTDVQFRRMAMLSGCDYLPSIPGIGLKKAHRMLRRFKTVEKLLQAIRMEGSHDIPPDYLSAFQQAELAFVYQRVYCPVERRLVPLNTLPAAGLSDEEEQWIGLDVTVEVARGMALGDLHPETRKPINDLWPDYQPSPKPGGPKKPDGLFAPAGKGTLDTFFARVKRTKSTPAVQPVGKLASGTSRLSDLPIGLARFRSEPSPSVTSAPKVSKFFGQRKPESPPPSTQKTQLSLHWEDSDMVPTQVERDKTPSPSPIPSAGCISPELSLAARSPSPEAVPSSPALIGSLSPAVSTRYPTPSQKPPQDAPTPVRIKEQPFSSPLSHVSSPPAHTPPDSLDRALDTRFSDAEDAMGQPEPSSPTPARVLIAASSMELFTATPTGAIYRSASQAATVSSSALSTLGTTRVRSLTSVLVPESSPSLGKAAAAVRKGTSTASNGSSSDSIPDNVITPIVDSVASTRTQKKRRVCDHEDEEEDQEAEARARIVSQNWSSRWSLGSQLSSPAPRKRDSIPLSATAPRILAARSLNVASPTVAKSSATPMAASDSPLPKAPHTTGSPSSIVKPAASQPHGLSWSALERFRFARR